MLQLFPQKAAPPFFLERAPCRNTDFFFPVRIDFLPSLRPEAFPRSHVDFFFSSPDREFILLPFSPFPFPAFLPCEATTTPPPQDNCDSISFFSVLVTPPLPPPRSRCQLSNKFATLCQPLERFFLFPFFSFPCSMGYGFPTPPQESLVFFSDELRGAPFPFFFLPLRLFLPPFQLALFRGGRGFFLPLFLLAPISFCTFFLFCLSIVLLVKIRGC